jgi:hypothetical protein
MTDTTRPDKYFKRYGSIGFPEEELLAEEMLHDGKRIKKKAQLIIVHHKTKNVGYKLNIDEFEVQKDGELIQRKHIPLNESATETIFKYLLTKDSFAEIARSSFYTVVESIAPLDKSTIEQLASLLKRAVQNKQLAKVVSSEVVDNFSAVIRQILYRKAIVELETMLQENHSEKDYEIWFLENYWVFGTEYVGTDDVKIGWRTDGDIILTSTDGYQDIIELKLPTKPVMLYDDSHKNWYPSSDLSKAIAQSIKYIQESEDVRMTIQTKEKLPFLKPRARVVIRRSNEWKRCNMILLGCLIQPCRILR